jgi:SnoaL-like domain
MKILSTVLFCLLFISCNKPLNRTENKTQTVKTINTFINQWHKNVAQSNFEAYFDKMTDDGVFVGTDASEMWSKKDFATFSKPYFDEKKTWNFKPLERHVHLDLKNNTAWFDEVLDTWMGLCRGSGVLQKTEKGWKIKQYVLSVTVPNDDIQAVISAKKINDSIALARYKNR